MEKRIFCPSKLTSGSRATPSGRSMSVVTTPVARSIVFKAPPPSKLPVLISPVWNIVSVLWWSLRYCWRTTNRIACFRTTGSAARGGGLDSAAEVVAAGAVAVRITVVARSRPDQTAPQYGALMAIMSLVEGLGGVFEGRRTTPGRHHPWDRRLTIIVNLYFPSGFRSDMLRSGNSLPRLILGSYSTITRNPVL